MSFSSLWNVLCFLVVTVWYFASFRPVVTYAMTEQSHEGQDCSFFRPTKRAMGTYLMMVVLSQWFLNLATGCTPLVFTTTQTWLPWIALFGGMMYVVYAYPGMKSVFSDVIGYYVVSTEAKHLFGQLLEQESADQRIHDTVTQIMGNQSLLINQLIPCNFASWWDTLQPIAKDKSDALRNALFDLVVKRDTLGEMCWYIYTGIVVSTFVTMRLASEPCAPSPQEQKDNATQFQQAQQQAQQQQQSQTSVVHSLI